MDADKHRAARMADVELHLAVTGETGLSVFIIGQLRKLPPPVQLIKSELQRGIGAQRLMLKLRARHMLQPAAALVGNAAQQRLYLLLPQRAG